MTPSEYAAIGRRVAAMRHHALGNGGCLSDRAALWELTQKLIRHSCYEVGNIKGQGPFFSVLYDDPSEREYDTYEEFVAALLESLGGTDG